MRIVIVTHHVPSEIGDVQARRCLVASKGFEIHQLLGEGQRLSEFVAVRVDSVGVVRQAPVRAESLRNRWPAVWAPMVCAPS